MNIPLSEVAFLWISTFFFTVGLFPLLVLIVVAVDACLGAMDYGFNLWASVLGMGCWDIEENGRGKALGFYVGAANQLTIDLNQLNAMFVFSSKGI